MKKHLMPLGSSKMQVPPIAVGCMRINSLNDKQIEQFVSSSMEAGLNFFDHADIYGGGDCETVFAKAVKALGTKREDMILQSKCGIVRGKRFDFSKKHILSSVDGILERLGTDYLDVLLLHRPDALVEPEEVAEAFDQLEKKGKVRHFGVSNHHPRQIDLLRRYVKQPILANQLQFGLKHTGMIDQGIHVNMEDEGAVDRDGGSLDYARLHEITIQAWSPFQFGFFSGVFVDNPDFPELNKALSKLAKKYEVSASTIAVAWILRHPAKIQVVTGTTKPERLQESVAALNVKLTRQEWYDLYLAAGNILP